MKKLMLLAAMLAVVVVAAVPAVAQVASQEFSERRNTSGAASPSVKISNTGDNANLCPTEQQVVNTGNVLNEQGVVQYSSKLGFPGDIDFSGSELHIDDASTTATCEQTIEQAAAAG